MSFIRPILSVITGGLFVLLIYMYWAQAMEILRLQDAFQHVNDKRPIEANAQLEILKQDIENAQSKGDLIPVFLIAFLISAMALYNVKRRHT